MFEFCTSSNTITMFTPFDLMLLSLVLCCAKFSYEVMASCPLFESCIFRVAASISFNITVFEPSIASSTSLVNGQASTTSVSTKKRLNDNMILLRQSEYLEHWPKFLHTFLYRLMLAE